MSLRLFAVSFGNANSEVSRMFCTLHEGLDRRFRSRWINPTFQIYHTIKYHIIPTPHPRCTLVEAGKQGPQPAKNPENHGNWWNGTGSHYKNCFIGKNRTLAWKYWWHISQISFGIWIFWKMNSHRNDRSSLCPKFGALLIMMGGWLLFATSMKNLR